MVTFTGCSISLGSLPTVRIISAMRPVAFAGILNLDLGSSLAGDFAHQIVLAVGEVDLADVGLIEVLAGNGDHVACLPTPRFDRRHAGHRLLGEQHESRKSRDEQKRALQKTVSSEYPFL